MILLMMMLLMMILVQRRHHLGRGGPDASASTWVHSIIWILLFGLDFGLRTLVWTGRIDVDVVLGNEFPPLLCPRELFEFPPRRESTRRKYMTK